MSVPVTRTVHVRHDLAYNATLKSDVARLRSALTPTLRAVARLTSHMALPIERDINGRDSLDPSDWSAISSANRRGLTRMRAWRDLPARDAARILRRQQQTSELRELLDLLDPRRLELWITTLIEAARASRVLAERGDEPSRALDPLDGFDVTRPALAPPVPAARQGRAIIAF